jgi:hypothetical protein
MNTDPMDQLRQWALQTITFEITVENASKIAVTKEVVEQNAAAAFGIADRFFTDSSAACASDANRGERVFVELVNRVLDWVVERRSRSKQSQATV